MRTLLYVPAHVARFVEKAPGAGADAVILDLEDAVPAGSKADARNALASAVPKVRSQGASVYVRVNNEAGLLDDDLAAAVAAGANGIILPKAETADDVRKIAAILQSLEAATQPPLRILPLIETPSAVLDARSIAASDPRIIGLGLGGEDLALEMHALPRPDVLHFPKLMVHYAAKASHVASFGLLRSIADISDVAAVTESAQQAAAFGFDGAFCVHPSLVPVLNAAFSPSPEQVAWARSVMEAIDKRPPESRGAFMLDGRMVDAPVIARARRVLARITTGSPPVSTPSHQVG